MLAGAQVKREPSVQDAPTGARADGAGDAPLLDLRADDEQDEREQQPCADRDREPFDDAPESDRAAYSAARSAVPRFRQPDVLLATQASAKPARARAIELVRPLFE